MENGEVVYLSQDFDMGSIAQIQCQSGYNRLSGDTKIFCGDYEAAPADPNHPDLERRRFAYLTGEWKTFALDLSSPTGRAIKADRLVCSMTSNYCPPPTSVFDTESVYLYTTTDAYNGINTVIKLGCNPGYRKYLGENELRCGPKIDGTGADGGEWKYTQYNSPGEGHDAL
jgi:hypothetical protein